MKKYLVAASAVIALGASTQANAAITLITGSFGSSGGVHSTPGLSASTVTGTVNGETVTLSTINDLLDTSGGGESFFAAHDGSMDDLTVTFTNSYSAVTFDLFKPNPGNTATMTLSVNGGAFNFVVPNGTITDPLGNGQNKFILLGTSGDAVHSMSFTFDPGIQDIREIRVGTNSNGVVTQQGVPEVATWALMLTGFGGLGALLRRRRRQAAAA